MFNLVAPPKPSSQVVPTEVCRTSSTIQIRFRKNYFSEDNGPVSIFLYILCLVSRISSLISGLISESDQVF